MSIAWTDAKEFLFLVASIVASITTVSIGVVAFFKLFRKTAHKVKGGLQRIVGVDVIIEHQTTIQSTLDEHLGQAKARDESIEALKSASQFTVRTSLSELCDKAIKKKSLTIYEQDILRQGEVVYQGLKGNGPVCGKIKYTLDNIKVSEGGERQ